MTLDEYQKLAFATAIYPGKGVGALAYPVCGLAGEAGEVANEYAKAIRRRG